MARRVLVVGDVMLDRYTHVASTRQAAEAPIPVWDIIREEYRLGGAANVANNLQVLGQGSLDVLLAGICGDDCTRTIRACGIYTDLLCDGTTLLKHRYVHENRVIFRCDNLPRHPARDVESWETRFARSLETLPAVDMVVISDYDKGAVPSALMRRLLDLRVPVVVDSKRLDLEMYRGGEVLKLNQFEHARQVSQHRDSGYLENLFKYVVVTKGPQGAELRMQGGRAVEQYPVEDVAVVDVTGCGDTHTAAMAYSLLMDGGDVRAAVRFANVCATTVVCKFGTATV